VEYLGDSTGQAFKVFKTGNLHAICEK